MSDIVTPPPTPPSAAEADPFRYGWRYVRRTLPDGTEDFDQVPLTLEDVLHPEEEDFIVQSEAHIRDWVYLRMVFTARLRDDPTAVVLTDCRVAWALPGMRAHGPDVVVFFGVQQRHNWRTFDVAREGVLPALIIEVTSPDTRDNDVVVKLDHYYRVGVPLYAIVDAHETEDERTLRLIGYRHTPQGYEELSLNEQGRLWLEPVGVWLGAHEGRVACYSVTGEEIGDYVRLTRDVAAAEQVAAAERARAEAAEEEIVQQYNARVAAAREAAEARARADAEHAQVEAAAQELAAERTRAAEERARAAAAEARAEALQARLAQIEEELRSRHGQTPPPPAETK